MTGRGWGALTLLCAAWVAGASGCSGAHRTGPLAIESLVDERWVAEAFPPGARLDTRYLREDGIQAFVADHSFERRRPEEHYLLAISLAPAGRLLDPAAYEARRAAARESKDSLRHELPEIGLRAQREFFGMGPGGAAYGLTFTTRDGRYDIRLVVSSLLPESVTEPTLDLDAFARRLSDGYDVQAR